MWVRVTLSAHALITRPHPVQGPLLLMVRLNYRDYRAGKWAFPGGYVDEGEGLEEALQREVTEEIGIRLRSWRQIQVVPFLSGERPHVGFVYLCEEWEGEPAVLTHELSETAWFDQQAFIRSISQQELAYPEMARQVTCLGWHPPDMRA